jgi:hypothetical protein
LSSVRPSDAHRAPGFDRHSSVDLDPGGVVDVHRHW